MTARSEGARFSPLSSMPSQMLRSGCQIDYGVGPAPRYTSRNLHFDVACVRHGMTLRCVHHGGSAGRRRALCLTARPAKLARIGSVGPDDGDLGVYQAETEPGPLPEP